MTYSQYGAAFAEIDTFKGVFASRAAICFSLQLTFDLSDVMFPHAGQTGQVSHVSMRNHSKQTMAVL